jgi:hypothetical protein
MQQRKFLTFDADLLDDSSEDSRGNVVTPNGRKVVERIVSKLRDRGIDVVEHRQHSFYGWAFGATYHSAAFYCILQHPKSWLLLIKSKTSLFDRLRFRASAQDLQAFSDLVLEELRKEPDFRSVELHLGSEFKAEGRGKRPN